MNLKHRVELVNILTHFLPLEWDKLGVWGKSDSREPWKEVWGSIKDSRKGSNIFMLFENDIFEHSPKLIDLKQNLFKPD